MPAPVAFLSGSLQYFSVDTQSETFCNDRHSGRANRTRVTPSSAILLFKSATADLNRANPESRDCLAAFYVEIPGLFLRTISE
jgi:hypothetical protein